MGEVSFGVPKELVADLARNLGLVAAVETGTFLGESALALREVFDRVVSLEVAADLHRRAVERYGDREGVTFLHGSSADLLPEVIGALDGPALFWLDGHWCPGVPQVQQSQCPVLAEIDAIDRSAHGGASAILIDDAHMHVAAPPPPFRREEWPTLLEVVDALRQAHPRYVTILDDVIVAGPPSLRPFIDAYWLRARYRDLYAERDDLRATLESERRPGPLTAARRLALSLVPDRVRAAIRASRAGRHTAGPT